MGTKPDEVIVRAAFADDGSLIRVWAIAELARRGVERQELLGLACDAISKARKRDHLQAGLPLGYLGAQRILESGSRNAVWELLKTMDGWTEAEQGMFFQLWAGERLQVILEEYDSVFGWKPKFSLPAPQS